MLQIQQHAIKDMIPEKKNNSVIAFCDALNKERDLIHRQIMASVSHDLKTPLSSIIGSLEIHDQMKTTLKAEKKQALLDTALHEAYRLNNFITNILDMAKLENNQIKVKYELCDIGDLLHTCIAQLSLRLHGSTANIKPAADIIVVTTDPSLLLRALGILLDNAVKYGGSPSLIHLSYAKYESGWVTIDVRDHGHGIAESTKVALFSKYTRFVRQDTQNAGTGLGLAICRELMRLLGGAVTAANHPDGGAIFSLRIPGV